MFKNYTNSSWNLLANNIKKFEKLNEEYLFINKEIIEMLENQKILNLETKIRNMQEKINEGNKIAEENIIKTDNFLYKINNININGRSVQRILSNLMNDINSFGKTNVSVEYALKRAEQSNKEIEYLSKALDFHQDRKVLDFCSDTINEVNSIYKYSQNIPNEKVQYLEKILEYIMNVDKHIEADIERVNFLNKKNSEGLKDLKNKIHYLKNKTEEGANEADHILSKIQVTNEILKQLQQVYENLARIVKNEKTVNLEERIKNHMLSSPEVETMFLGSIKHVQELENKVRNYSR